MKPKFASYILPSLRDIFFLAIFVTVLALGNRMLNLDGDLPRHLLTGKLVLQTRAVPTTEPFAYPYAGKTYVSHEWLADVILYLLYKYISLVGVIILAAFLLASTFTILFSALVKQKSLRLPTLLIVAWGAAATSLNWAARPHLISMLLLAIWLVWTDQMARGEKSALWKFPVLMVLWGNLHGEFIAGILVTFAYAVGWLWDFLSDRANADVRIGRNLGLAVLLSMLATLVNPAGIRPWMTILGFVNNSYLMSRMYESNPPNFQQSQFLVLLGLLAISLVILALKRGKISAGRAFVLAGFSAMSLIAARNIHLYGVVAPFVLAAPLSEILSGSITKRLEATLQSVESQLRGVLWPVATVLVLGILLIGTTAKNLYQFSPSFFPVDAVRWLESHPQQGHMLNNLDWGGYIALRLWPEQQVFVDSMADTSGELTMQYERAFMAYDGWQDVLATNQVDWVIVPPEAPIVSALEETGWDILYQDEIAIILQKR
jgi:hypothetical protein